jgi:hypothetical protein
MLAGTALALSELPEELMIQHGLARRVYDRGGEREVQFLFADAERLLPVWRNGQLQILRWGNRRGESAHLPCTAWKTAAGANAASKPSSSRRRWDWTKASGIASARACAAWWFATSAIVRAST